MKFIVKLRSYEIGDESKPYAVYFFGKDGYVNTDSTFAEGWKQRRFAEAFIKRDIENTPNTIKIEDHLSVECNRWINFYEIIEIED